jgi:hypothetical protein
MAWKRRRVTILLVVSAAALVAAVGSWLGYYLFGAALDNRLGVLIGRDIRLVQEARVGDETVRDLINHRYTDATWSGWHREEVWRTFVECHARSTDRDEVRFVWEVDHGFSPADGGAKEGVYIFALTRDTGALTPQYIPRGLAIADLPSAPSMTATALHGLIGR